MMASLVALALGGSELPAPLISAAPVCTGFEHDV